MLVDAAARWLSKRLSGTSHTASGCQACGQCCEAFGGTLSASRADLERWQRLGRSDVLRWVNRLGWLWVDPETGRRVPRCPFLERSADDRALCAIHPIKPDICRDYPTLAHRSTCMRGRILAWFFPVALYPPLRKLVLYAQNLTLCLQPDMAHWSGVMAFGVA